MKSVLHGRPSRIFAKDVAVLEHTTADELLHIREAWSWFEQLVGLQGRRMYARADETAGTYTVCTPVRPDDDPAELGLALGTLPGGWYLRGGLKGAPPAIYESIGPGMTELRTLAPVDPTRPLVEYYRRHDRIELWVPVAD